MGVRREQVARSGRRRSKIGILDETGSALGGAQLVNATLAGLLSRDHDVELVHSGTGYGLGELERAFGVNLASVKERRIEALADHPGFGVPGSQPALHQMRDSWDLTRPYDLFIYSGSALPPVCFAGAGLVYCHFPFADQREGDWTSDPRWIERGRAARWARGHAYRLFWRAQISRYRCILANSGFTATWILRRWGKASEVVYPPVEINVPSHAKRSLIVSLGRITGGRRSKGQLEQIGAFRELSRRSDGNWEFAIVGFSTSSSEDQRYLEVVRREAEGLPVSFHVNVDRNSTCLLLAEASLFWHTGGLHIDEEALPALAEHFGIATVEAMRAGCVPIVINAGGQREIVENGVSGFLVRDLEEMVERSLSLARNPELCSSMGEQARSRSRLFTREAFERRIMSIIARLITS